MTLGEAQERAQQGRNGISPLDSPEPSGSGRRLPGRRRALPTGRAVAGGLLIALAAVAVSAAALRGTNEGDAGTFVVAAGPLQAGSVIEPGDLGTESIHLPRGVAAGAYTSTAELDGRTLAVAVGRGQLVESSMLVAVGQAQQQRPVTVPADSSALAGLYAGEPVDVLQAATGADTSSAVTVVLRGATLLAIARPGSNIFAGPSTASVTLGVATLEEVEAVIAAAHSGTLVIVASTPEDGVGPGAGAGAAGGSGAGGGNGSSGASASSVPGP